MNKQKCTQQGFGHLLLIVIIAIVLAFIGFAGYRLFNSDKVQKNGSTQLLDSWKTDCSGTGTVNLTHQPMSIKDVSTIVPLGSLAGPHVTPIDHLYFYPKEMNKPDAAPVYAMADGYIVSYENRQQNGYRAIHIVMQHTCSFYTYFDLMTSMVPSLENQIKDGKGHVPIKAGDVVGYVGGQSLDTAVYNLDLKLKGFVKPDSYSAEPWKIHTDDFFKYFSGKNLSEMLALNARKVEPYSGKIDYDIEGKLVGNWFQEGTNGYDGPTTTDHNQFGNIGYYSGHLSIAPDAVNPSLINVSTGSYEGAPKQFTILSAKPAPEDVGTDSGEVKYELIQYTQPGPSLAGQSKINKQVLATALFKVLPNNKLKVEIFPGKTAVQVSGFTSAAITYER